MKGRDIFCLGWAFMLLVMASCRERAFLPKSGGRLYEVVVVDDRDSLLYDALSTRMEGLPQREPCFDVTELSSEQFTGNFRLARNIIMLKIDSTRYETTEMRMQRDAYARPQVVVSLTAPTQLELQKFLQKSEKTLLNYLIKSEMAVTLKRFYKEQNTQAEKTINEMFGATMRIAGNMTSSKKGNNFLWLSNNANSGMENICLYTISKADFKQQRDSVMRRNIPGERDNMFMTTAAITSTSVNKGKSVTIRGLWEMKNDAMGGPFVAYIRTDDGRKDSFLVAEAFVYAPETRKRNLTRRLETALYTLKSRPKAYR